MVRICALRASEIGPELFSGFERTQNVTRCWRKEAGSWVVREIAFVDDWTEEDYALLVRCLRHTAAEAGLVIGAFQDEKLQGFASVEPGRFGSRMQYMDLSSLHVSRPMRGKGIGTKLFCRAKEFAREHGAQKLYISAHSAVETQAFYRAMGCVEAEEPNAEHVEKEPCDCQLECVVSRGAELRLEG